MMAIDPETLLHRFRGVRATVIGDAILDRYAECSLRRLDSGAPVPVVELGREVCAPGGAANVAANLAALGARTTLVAVTGRDQAGERLRADLVARGVDVTTLLSDPSCRTHQKTRVIADGQYLVRMDEGRTAGARHLYDAVDSALCGADVVVISDH